MSEQSIVIESAARGILKDTVFDMFFYYALPNHPVSSVDRLNCLGISDKLTYALRENTAFPKDYKAFVIPFESDHYTPEQFAEYPFGHTAVLVENDNNKIIGVVDPTYGIFIPIWLGSISIGNGWEFSIHTTGNDFFMQGIKKGKTMQLKFYPERKMQEKDKALFQEKRTQFQREAHSYILSPKDGSKITRVEINNHSIRYKGQQGEQVYNISHDPNETNAEAILDRYVKEVNGILAPLGKKLDLAEFQEGIASFWKVVRGINSSKKSLIFTKNHA